MLLLRARPGQQQHVRLPRHAVRREKLQEDRAGHVAGLCQRHVEQRGARAAHRAGHTAHPQGSGPAHAPRVRHSQRVRRSALHRPHGGRVVGPAACTHTG